MQIYVAEFCGEEKERRDFSSDDSSMPLLDYHLIVIGFAYPSNPRISALWDFMPLVRPPVANKSLVRDQIKRSQRPLIMININFPCLDTGHHGPLLEPALEAEHDAELLVARAQPEEAKWDPLPVGSPPTEEGLKVGCIVCCVAAEGRDLGDPISGRRS